MANVALPSIERDSMPATGPGTNGGAGRAADLIHSVAEAVTVASMN
jgi:hypothetical protein